MATQKISLRIDYQLGDTVYLKGDAQELQYIVTGITMRAAGIVYEISYAGEAEISVYSTQLVSKEIFEYLKLTQ